MTIKKFNEFLDEGIIKKQFPNKPRANDLTSEAERKHKSLKEILHKIGLNDENANDIIEYCYDIMINLIRAKMLLKGLSSSGQGAHEAEISYLKELNFSENDIYFADRLRYFRNGILYYGKRFNKEYADKVLSFMEKIKKRLA